MRGCSIKFTFQGYIGWSFLFWCFLLPSPQDVSVMSRGHARRSNSKFPSLNKWHWWNCAPIAVVLVLVYCQTLLWAHRKKGRFYIYTLCIVDGSIFCPENSLPELKQRMGIPPTPRKRALESYMWRKKRYTGYALNLYGLFFFWHVTNGAEVLVAFDLWSLILIIPI